MRPVFGKTLFTTRLLTTLFFALSATAALAAPAVRGPADVNQLPAELKGQDIKTVYAPTGANRAGVIQTVIGRVIVAPDAGSPYYAAAGDALFEKDVVITLAGSRCRFQLIGGDVAMMGEKTHLGIKSLEWNPKQSTRSSVLTVHKGKAVFYALPSFKFRKNLMQVETPSAIGQTSGAKWGVEVYPEKGMGRASLPILVADNSPDGGFRLLAQANPPSLPLFQTTILCFSGTVFTGSTAPPPPGAPPPVVTLLQGQMTTVGAGAPPAPPSITPLSLANSFTAGTFAPPPGGSLVLNHLTLGGTNLTLMPPPDTTNIVQQQNQTSRPTRHEGFAVGMLTSGSNFTATYASLDSRDFDAGQGTAFDATNEARMSTTALLGLQVVQGTAVSGLPQALVKNELGYNAYMEWGSWTQPIVMGGSYVFNNKGYYVWGDRTTTLPATISGTYRGDAYGTIWNAGGGADLGKGTVSMDVSYAGGSGTVKNFNLMIGNTGVQQTGTATFNTTGNYQVSGTGYVQGATGTGNAYGNFYGPAANWTGGVWKASAGGQNANGNFVASKP